MPNLERFESDIMENESALRQALKEKALQQARATGSIAIVVGLNKPGIAIIGIVTDESGRSTHLVNATSARKVVASDAAKTRQYPDIIIDPKRFSLETVLKKFSEFLFLEFQMQNIQINAFKSAKSFKRKETIGIFNPHSGTLELAI